MNWAYALLGISADADATTIKRAYARLLRTTRPDEDAAAFQRLNTAYQMALAQAAQHPVTSPAPSVPMPAVNEAAEPTKVSISPATAQPNPPAATPTALEMLKPPASSEPAPVERPIEILKSQEEVRPLVKPAPKEVLKTSAAPSPAAPPAPLEVLKAAAPGTPKPAARRLEVLQPPEPRPVRVIPPKELAEQAIREASNAKDPAQLSLWLDRKPEFWPLQVKQATGQLLLQQLLREPQPMAATSLDALLRFFDLDHVLSGVNPIALEQLRQKQTLQWEMLHDHAAMARRLRIQTDKGFPNTKRVRDCIHLLKQPRSWRTTFMTALTRNKTLQLARIVYALCNGEFTALPYVIDREHARFWFRAAGGNGFTRERFTLSAIRAFSIALACAVSSFPIVLLSMQNGHIPPEGWWGAGQVSLFFFGSVLSIWATLSVITWLDRWQGLPEATELRKPWLQRLFIPTLIALGLLLDYAANAPTPASIVIWGAFILALRRFSHRTPKRTGRFSFKLNPRALIYLLLGGVIGLGNIANQIPGSALDNIPLLGTVAGVALLVWGFDMWRHRAYLRAKPAHD